MGNTLIGEVLFENQFTETPYKNIYEINFMDMDRKF